MPLKAPDIEIVEQASNGREAIAADKTHSPDVILMDIVMPDMDGIEATRAIRKQHPDVKIIMLTTFDDRELVREALHAGADGYILKTAPVDDVVDSIRSAFGGNVLLTSDVVEKLLEPDSNAEADGYRHSAELLTHREMEVLHLMTEGLDNSHIAARLAISEKTVRNYVSEIYSILGVHNRTQAVLWAQKRRL